MHRKHRSNSKKASGPDEFAIVFLKQLNNLISPIISKLVNESFKTGIYPDCLKLAKVIPIYKGGKKSCAGNYRPISLLSIINKIIEKIIYSRLISFLDKYNIINQNQFGFRQGYSTTMAVAQFYENILNSYDILFQELHDSLYFCQTENVNHFDFDIAH